jgi:ferredoxin-thioredoxin reductase catalytic subunit
MRWTGHEERMMERRGGCRVLMGKAELKRQFARPSFRREDDIKTIR